MRYLGIGLVYAWRYSFGLLTPPGRCKYHPSCSQYALDAFEAHGFVTGAALAGWRLLRCNPWSHGGVDYITHPTQPAQPARPARSAAREETRST